MELDYSTVKDMEMALRYAIKYVEKELEICRESKDTTQEEVLKKRLERFEFILVRMINDNKA